MTTNEHDQSTKSSRTSVSKPGSGYSRGDFGARCDQLPRGERVPDLVWAVTGAGYFWPIWVIGGWGVGLALHAWDTLLRKPVAEADVDAELTRQRRS